MSGKWKRKENGWRGLLLGQYCNGKRCDADCRTDAAGRDFKAAGHDVFGASENHEQLGSVYWTMNVVGMTLESIWYRPDTLVGLLLPEPARSTRSQITVELTRRKRSDWSERSERPGRVTYCAVPGFIWAADVSALVSLRQRRIAQIANQTKSVPRKSR